MYFNETSKDPTELSRSLNGISTLKSYGLPSLGYLVTGLKEEGVSLVKLRTRGTIESPGERPTSGVTGVTIRCGIGCVITIKRKSLI